MNTFERDYDEEGSCKPVHEERLNAFVDGELPIGDQAALFEHLSLCSACRSGLDAVLTFRRMSRQEYLAVPSSLDSALMKRLARLQAVRKREARLHRRSFAPHTLDVSPARAVAVAAAVFFLGMLMPRPVQETLPTSGVHGVQERVLAVEAPAAAQPVYVFYPGLTVEAEKEAE